MKNSLFLLPMLVFCCACESPEGRIDAADLAGSDEGASEDSEPDIEPVGPDDGDRFARLAGTFVASKPLTGGARVYFAQPKPYGSWLCRVDRVYLPEWIVTGRPKAEDKFWEDDLSVVTLYAAWRSPSDTVKMDRDEECRSFDNFDSLFSAKGESGNPSRYIYVLDQLLSALKDDQFNNKVTCIDRRHGGRAGTKVCDPNEVLKGVSISSPFSGSTTSETEVGGGKIYEDAIYLDRGYDHGHPVMLSIEFESLQTYGEQSNSEADIKAVAISIDVL